MSTKSIERLRDRQRIERLRGRPEFALPWECRGVPKGFVWIPGVSGPVRRFGLGDGTVEDDIGNLEKPIKWVSDRLYELHLSAAHEAEHAEEFIALRDYLTARGLKSDFERWKRKAEAYNERTDP